MIPRIIHFCACHRLVYAIIARRNSRIEIHIVITPGHVDIYNSIVQSVICFQECAVGSAYCISFRPKLDTQFISDA